MNISDSWKSLISRTSAQDLVKDRQVISFEGKTTVFNCLEDLAYHDITSAPIVDSNKKFRGFVDVLDIVGYVSFIIRSLKPISKWSLEDHFFSTAVEDLLNPLQSTFYLKTSSNLQEVFTFFQKNFLRPHRVALINNEEDLIVQNLITQSDLVSFLHCNMEALGPFRMRTIEELKLGRACVMVDEKSSFADALSILRDNSVTGLALINNQGKLVGNLSASDLRRIKAYFFSNLSWTVEEFLSKGTEKIIEGPLVTCKCDSTFSQILDTIIKHKVHRVYIVNDDHKPLGVITLTDILALLNNQ